MADTPRRLVRWCNGVNVEGTPCTNEALREKDHCRWHSPEALAARAELEAAKAKLAQAVKPGAA